MVVKYIGKDLFLNEKSMNNNPYLNLGCGTTFHQDWHNIDFVSTSKYVQPYNLLKGIPCNNESKTVVYHSHVLEHFSKTDAVKFIKECHRVLKQEGVIRIAIPNLEQIALNYIKYLNESVNGTKDADKKYEWTMLEMYDQVVRNNSGGQMIEYISDKTKNNDEFLLERNGQEVKHLMETLRENFVQPKTEFSISGLFSKIHTASNLLKEFIYKCILLNDYKYYAIGKFRLQGEIHQWMYDHYSLKQILLECGFRNVQTKTAFESNIPNWEKYQSLDVTDGKVRKPDSLFMEAFK